MECRATILVVEEDAQLLRLIGLVLGRAGYSVLQARTRTVAAQLLRKQNRSVDLVVLDSASRTDFLHHGRKLLVLSGDGSGDAFLPKPFKPATLVQTVKSLLS